MKRTETAKTKTPEEIAKEKELIRIARNEYVRRHKAARTPEQVEKDLAYRREWNRKNADKVKAARERFYLKRAAEYKLSADPAEGN